jgi:hypothetical protein
MSEDKEMRVLTASPLPPVLHGVRLSAMKCEKKVHAISDSHASSVE